MKVLLRTFGCRANQYDTEVVRAMVEAAGGRVVDDADVADVAIFNSCAVTSDAVADLRQDVRRLHRESSGTRAVIMGCASALDDGALASLPGVTDVVPGADLPRLAAALGVATTMPPAQQAGSRGLLRIQDGCAEHCTFCATTLARGAHRSRPADDLVREARMLAAHHAEIVLTGIHIGHWGREHGASLGLLVQRLLRDVPGVRFRLSSVEATEVDDALRECFDDPARLAPHLHAPLQSGSDAVLRHMGRHWYTARGYVAALERVIEARAVFGLGADVITGFPGESADDHAATLAVLQSLPFTYLHVFPYSPRPGTAATRLPGEVAPPVARARAAELRLLGASFGARYEAARSGGSADVVVTHAGRRGLTGDYLSVRVEGRSPGRGERFPARVERLADGTLAAYPDPA